MLKKCSKCKEEKQESEFYKGRPECKCCRNSKVKEYQTLKKDDIKEQKKDYYIKNKSRIDERNKAYIEKEENKNKRKLYEQDYYRKNKDKINSKNRAYNKMYQASRYSNDPYFRFSNNLRKRIKQAFKLYSKNGKTETCKEYGIDFSAIYKHVGPKPEGDFHLDHIIPLSVFNLDNVEHVRLAHLPQNLQWLPSKDNISKRDSIYFQLVYCSLSLMMIAKYINLI